MHSDAGRVEWIDVRRIFSLKQHITNTVWYDHSPLVSSVKQIGIVCPIILRKTQMNRFEVIDGEKRLRAAVLCGMNKVPSVILNCTSDEAVCLHFQLHHLHTEPHYFDIAYFYTQLQKQGWTIEKIASSMCVSTVFVEQKLQLLQNSEKTINKLITYDIDETVALSLLALPPSIIDRTLDYIISNHINTQGAVKHIQAIYRAENDKITSGLAQIVRNALRKATVLAEREHVFVQMKEQSQKDATVFLFKIKHQN